MFQCFLLSHTKNKATYSDVTPSDTLTVVKKLKATEPLQSFSKPRQAGPIKSRPVSKRQSAYLHQLARSRNPLCPCQCS